MSSLSSDAGDWNAPWLTDERTPRVLTGPRLGEKHASGCYSFLLQCVTKLQFFLNDLTTRHCPALSLNPLCNQLITDSCCCLAKPFSGTTAPLLATVATSCQFCPQQFYFYSAFSILSLGALRRQQPIA